MTGTLPELPHPLPIVRRLIERVDLNGIEVRLADGGVWFSPKSPELIEAVKLERSRATHSPADLSVLARVFATRFDLWAFARRTELARP